MSGPEATVLALTVPCPACQRAAGTECIPPADRPELNDPHLARLQRSLVVTDATDHNLTLESS